MSKVLVTGGNGFLGQHLVQHFAQQGETIRILARPAPQTQTATAIPLGADGAGKDAYDIETFWGDIRDADAVDRAVAGVDRVVHLVSNFRKGGSDKQDAYDINVTGTENVLRAALKYDIERVVHCSTIGVHGDVKEIPATEETAFNPGDLYQETKLTAEQTVWAFHRQTKLPITVVRPISLIGPGDQRMLKLFRMIKKGRFVVVGQGDAFFQPAYIEDVTAGFYLCLHHPAAVGEAFIIGGEEYVPLRELIQMIAHELAVTPPKWKIPMLPVLLLAQLCEQFCVPLGIEPPLHRRRVSFYQNNRAFSVAKAKRILGYQPQVSLRDGIRRTIRWYEQHQWL